MGEGSREGAMPPPQKETVTCYGLSGYMFPQSGPPKKYVCVNYLARQTFTTPIHYQVFPATMPKTLFKLSLPSTIINDINTPIEYVNTSVDYRGRSQCLHFDISIPRRYDICQITVACVACLKS